MGIVAHSVFGLTEILVRTIRYQRHQKGGYPTPPPDQLIREGIRFDPRRSLDHRVRFIFLCLSLAYLGEARGPQVFQSGVVVINPKQYSALVRFLEFQGSSDAKLLLWICFRCDHQTSQNRLLPLSPPFSIPYKYPSDRSLAFALSESPKISATAHTYLSLEPR